MIIDIPTPDELARSSVDLLNLAWETAFDILYDLEESGVEEWDDDGTARRDYHAASQPSLGNALAIVQQAQELALKSRIAAISPYLLLSGDPREWPRQCDKNDTAFTSFRTIDASDLIRVHDAVCNKRLDAKFVQIFTETRRKRNVIIHLGGKGQIFNLEDLLLLILETFRHLFPNKRWAQTRYEFKLRDRNTQIYGPDFVEAVLVHQFNQLTRVLGAKDLRTHFGFEKKQHRYICFHCTAEERNRSGETTPLAQLRPNTPEATTLYCCVCDKEYPVERRYCSHPNCKSNVISTDKGWEGTCHMCMTEARAPTEGET